jgi:hypothetical protein
MKPAKMKNFEAQGCRPTSQYTMALKMMGMGSCRAVSAVILAMK